jgi:aminomethyltransferase
MGLKMIDTGIPRQGYPILKEGVRVGTVTSGTLSPTLEKSIGLGFINADVKLGEEVEIMSRNSLRKAIIVSIPFYTNNQ